MTKPSQEAGTPAAKPEPAAPQDSLAGNAPPKAKDAAEKPKPVEIGGPAGPEPTRFGDWERKGRVSDF